MTNPPARISRAYAGYALGLLALINVLNYLDRNIVFALFEPIKDDLGLSDTELGWIGSAYVIVYALAAVPLGVLADLKSRRAVIAVGVSVWSAFTAVGGLARHFWHLFLARAMVGVGEASYSPAAQSLIADYFPGRGRAFALGIFWGGLALGGVAGIWLGGELEHLYGWRAAFLAVGIPGFILAMLAAQLRDPARARVRLSVLEHVRRFELTVWRFLRATWPTWGGGLVAVVAVYVVDRTIPGQSDVEAAVFSIVVGIGLAVNVALWVRHVIRQRHDAPLAAVPRSTRVDDFIQAGRVVLHTPTLVWLFIGGAMIAFAMNGLVGWSPSYMHRELGLTPQTAGRTIGLWGLAGGILGAVFGGRLGDHLVERFPGGRVVAGALGFLFGGPLAVALLLVRDLDVFIPLFFVTIFFFTWYHGPMTAAIFDVVPAQVGASVIGAYVFFTHIAGDAVAFPVVGILSDRFGIRWAMLLLPVVAILGGAVVLLSLRTIRRDMERGRRATGEYRVPEV